MGIQKTDTSGTVVSSDVQSDASDIVKQSPDPVKEEKTVPIENEASPIPTPVMDSMEVLETFLYITYY